MGSQLHILLIEDSANDAALIESELKTAHFDFDLRQIHSELELRRELEARPPDLIVSDHGLPSFDGFSALDIVREKYPRLPFIFVSGSNNQGMVAEMYDRGATDYVFKRDLHDLGEAVQRALATDPPTATPEVADLATGQPSDLSTPPPELVLLPSRLFFCPACLQARTEWGVPVALVDFCRTHEDTVIIRTLCADCEPPQVA